VKADTASNVLSTPSVTTLDNQPARILVGQNVPIATGQALSNNFDNSFRTVERRDIGIALDVRPQINAGGSIKLALRQEVSSIANSVLTQNVPDLILNKREISTTVTVDDGQIIALGGLIDENERRAIEKVPLLGDIPVLGNLFRSRSRNRTKTNLMVFLRPTVIRTDAQSIAVASDRYDYIRGAQQNVQAYPNALLPPTDAPRLPPLDNGKPVGGSLLHRGPETGAPPPSSGTSHMQPSPPPEVFPVEPPVIDQR
jgi:general secretion pathway protein D